MKVLIELYDKDTLKNIVAPLTLRPDRVVYLYDKGMDDRDAFRSLVTCFQKNMPNIVVEDIPVDISSVKTLCAAVCPCGRAVRGGKLHAGADGRQ